MGRFVFYIDIVFCFAVCCSIVKGQDQGQQRIQRQETPVAAVNGLSQEPNRPREVNAMDFMMKQNERLRQSARDRIRQRATERSWQAIDGSSKRVRPKDINAPGFRKRPGNVERRMPVEQPLTGEAQQHQLNAIDQQLSYEQGKHMERLARLNRIRDLAQQSNDNEVLARVDKLIKEEEHLYNAKSQRMSRRKERIAEFSQKSSERAKEKISPDMNTDNNQPGGK